MRHFQHSAIHSDGAGAIYLKRNTRPRQAVNVPAEIQNPESAVPTKQNPSPSAEPAATNDGRQSLVELTCVTDAFPFTKNQNRSAAARAMKAQLLVARPDSRIDNRKELLCLGTQNLPRNDAVEAAVWKDWTGSRLAPKESLGEAFSASAAWQCVLACDAVRRMEFSAANVSVVGTNQQAIGVRFGRADSQAAV
jgi:hypothetical protein